MKDLTENGKTMFRIIGASNHTDDEREQDDYYATDPIALEKLLMVEYPNNQIWECACGAGHLSEALRICGYKVFSSDIRDRGYDHFDGEIDFLTAHKAPFTGNFDILTNPPYKYAKDFVVKSLGMLSPGCRCYMFLKLTFLESKARYAELFKNNPPRRIHVFSERILCAKNGDFERMRKSGGSCVAFAWFVWEKGYQGETTVGWI